MSVAPASGSTASDDPQLYEWQDRLFTLTRCTSVDDALDCFEQVLDRIVPLHFARLLRVDGDTLAVWREFAPAHLTIADTTLRWATRQDRLVTLPDPVTTPEGASTVLLIPLNGHGEPFGIQILWVGQQASAITRQQCSLLTLLGRTTGLVIESLIAHAQTAQHRRLLESVVDSVPHGLLAIDRLGRVQLLNSTLEILLGIRRGAVQGKSYADVLPEAFHPSLQAWLDRTVQMSATTSDEREIQVQISGVEERFSLSTTPILSEPGGVVLLCRNLKLSTEVARLRELDAMKNDFISLVSHELRTPLTSIMAYSETLMMDGMVEHEEERLDYLRIIHQEGGRLTRLINEMLDLSKMEAGKMEYHFAPLPIGDLLRTAVQNTQALAVAKQIDIDLQVAADLPVIQADRDRMLQVLLNLLSNAIKFTPEQGRIQVQARRGPPLPGQQEDSLLISVQDNGIGIAPEHLHHVFAKFEQVESVDHHTSGTGLGMPICKQIVEDGHGGRIWLESTLGVGTCVYVQIPPV